MPTFDQKPKAPQQAASAEVTIPVQASFGQSQAVKSILHLQHTIGNQAVQRLLHSNAEEIAEGLAAIPSTHFDHDFSRLRANTDRRAGESAQAINALAFSAKWDTVFGTGQFARETSNGRTLPANELTQALQQRTCSQGIPFIQRTPGEEGDSRERLRLFARDPGQALVNWSQLDSGEQEELLDIMASLHGRGFAESFERIANSLRGAVNVRNYSDYRTVDRRRLESNGWNLIGRTIDGFDFGAHPSGGAVMVSTGEAGETQRREEPAQEDRSVSPPASINIPRDPAAAYGPIVAMSDTFLGVEADARLYANGNIEVYYEGSDNPMTYVPVPDTESFYQLYNEEGEASGGSPVDVYREFPDYLAEELGLTE